MADGWMTPDEVRKVEVLPRLGELAEGGYEIHGREHRRAVDWAWIRGFIAGALDMGVAWVLWSIFS
jgi:hypothetical protein